MRGEPRDPHRVGRRPRVPESLTHGVFTLEEARRAGLTRWHLEGSSWRRVGPGTYAWAGLTDVTDLKLAAASRRLPPTAVFSGLTAAWLHGLDVVPCEPIEATIPKGCGISGRSGLAIRRYGLTTPEIVKIRGRRATSIVRTLLDVSARLSVTEAVVVGDMALHRRLLSLQSLRSSLAAYAGQPGVARLRHVMAHVEPASESPMESRVRMLLVLAGLPRPQAQVPVHDTLGRFVGRPDLYYPERRLGLEYDGGTHRETLADDNRRQNLLLDAGVTLLRFTARDVLGTPDMVVKLVRRALAA
jgi:very-short-patch-repair endonuclease